MKKRTINLFVLGLATLIIALFGCSSGNVADTTATGAAIDGAALYTNDCSGCHGPLATSGKKGATVAQIQDAIAHNWGGMGAFSSLTADQLQAVSTALAPVTTTDTPATVASLDGVTLYTDNCSSCHGPLATSGKGGALASAIQAAIASNSGGMGRFSNLTTAQLQAIADALATVQATTPGPAPATADGAALYSKYCSGCHGSSKQGSSAVSIQNAIDVNRGGMGSLSGLTSAQIQAIATGGTAPTQTPAPLVCGSCHAIPPATGQHTYHVTSQRVSCGTCHGTGYSSTTVNTATHQNGTVNIASTIGWNATSRSCSNSCHGTQNWGGSTAPAPTPTPAPTDGAALYTTYCSSCHGSLSASSKAGRTAAQITAAITSVSSMNSLSNLTSTQIQAIASALATAPIPAPTDGAALYTTYCSSCHGALSASSKGGRTAAQIQTAITNNAGGMGSLSNLTTTQVQAIATALGTTPAPAPTPVPTACGSCHAIPPATGHHTYHVTSQRVSCGTCHGTGYSSTTVNTATHNNGVVNIASTPGWNPTTRSCSNSCHGTKSW